MNLELVWAYQHKEKVPYNEVLRIYLLGLCYDKTGNQKMAKECMQYVAEHGNTMPCRKEAEKWLIKRPLTLLEQREDIL